MAARNGGDEDVELRIVTFDARRGSMPDDLVFGHGRSVGGRSVLSV